MITEGELQSLLMAILVAGYETTANQLGKFVLCLLERPDQLRILREHPELMANAVEELMRFVPLSAGSQLAYLATEDVEIGGVLIRAGEGVMPSTASANRDESVFPHADEVDVERHRHLPARLRPRLALLPRRAPGAGRAAGGADVVVRPLPRAAAGRSRRRGAVEGRLGRVGARSPAAPLLTPLLLRRFVCEV